MINKEELDRALSPKLLPYFINKSISNFYNSFYSAVDNYAKTLELYNNVYNNYLTTVNKMVK